LSGSVAPEATFACLSTKLGNMVLVLCIGDLHIPSRAADLPAKFKALLMPGKIHLILCPGNLVSKEAYDYLRGVCGNVHVSKGEFDDIKSLAEDEVLAVGDFRIGLCHGHQVVPWGDPEALAALQRKLDVDILVSGHTHEFKAVKLGGALLVNPGSATGAYSTVAQNPVPSFVLIDINGPAAVLYVYELIDGQVKVDKLFFNKADSLQGHAAGGTA